MEITLKLSLSEVNFLLNKLEQFPYGEVKGLIGKIENQGNEQVQKADLAKAEKLKDESK